VRPTEVYSNEISLHFLPLDAIVKVVELLDSHFWRPMFYPTALNLEIFYGQAALGQVFHGVLWLLPVSSPCLYIITCAFIIWSFASSQVQEYH